MKTKQLIKTLAILLIVISVFVVVVYSQQYSQIVQGIIDQIGGPIDQEWDENAARGRYSACCVNADGYCLDLFESDDDVCGEYEWISDDFCGNVPNCKPLCCYIDGVEQKYLMNKYECKKLALDTGTSNWDWNSNCNSLNQNSLSFFSTSYSNLFEDNTPITFAVIGDTHAGIDRDEFPNYRQWADANHAVAVNEIKRLNPDFYIHVGDMVQESTPSNWNSFFSIETPIMTDLPIFPTIGNHERYNVDHSYYYKFRQFDHLDDLLTDENKPWYSFDWGYAHFVSLRLDYDPIHNIYGEACEPGSEQYEWLVNDLSRNTKPWTIVFFHVSFYSSLSELDDRKEIRQVLHPLFKQYGIDLVLSGHDHYYERVEADGIVYVVSGGGNNVWDTPNPIAKSKKLLGRNHIVKITIDENSLSGTAISTRGIGRNWQTPGGEVLDTFSLTR